MTNKNKIKKVVVIGAGISGATAANELSKKLNIPAKNIAVLEINDHVGGEVENFSHPAHPALVTPLGAGVLTHNYPIIDYIKEKNIKLESILPAKKDSVDIIKELRSRSLFGKFTYCYDFLKQNAKFAKHAWDFNQACKNLSETLPKDQELTFEEFQQKYKLDKIKSFLQCYGPEMGYGQFHEKDSYAYRYFAYMGMTTILGISTSIGLVSIKGGYQTLIERMLEDFDVKTSATVQSIVRSSDGVNVTYKQNDKLFNIDADMLVLAVNPHHYKELGMELTEAEEECAQTVSSRPYATAAVRIKGAEAQHVFLPNATNEKSFRHPSFIYTLDARELKNNEDGRQFTVYINLAQDDVNFSLEPGTEGRKNLEEDLKKFFGVNEIIVDKVKIWPHYNPVVPWKTAIKLQKEELMDQSRTVHVGAFLRFETVGAASDYAIKTINRWLGHPISTSQELWQGIKRSFYFFTVPKAKPVDDKALEAEMHVSRKLGG